MSDSSEGTLNLNGGTLQANGDSSEFLADLTCLVQIRGGTTPYGTPYGGVTIDTNGHSVTINRPLVHSTISGDSATDGGLVKTGAGTLILTVRNTYTGPTTVAGGTLQLSGPNGGITSTGLVEVLNGATLSGTGFVSGNVIAEAGSVISPGVNGPGVLGLGDHLVLSEGAILSIDLDGTVAGSGYDRVDLDTAIALNGGDLQVQVAKGSF